MSASAVVLAAGTSARWTAPEPKQLFEIDGEQLVRRIVRRALASAAREVIVVVGHREGDVRAALADLDVRIVSNPDYEQGRSSSVRAALAALDPSAQAAIFLPVDQPHLDTGTLDLILTRFAASGKPIGVPRHGRRRGAPVIFSRSLFSELAGISGDEGGRQLLPAHLDEILDIELESPLPLQDVDTIEAWNELSDP